MPRRIGKSPSLWQTLLNRPSQSYAFPQVDKKEYYSAKNDMAKIAMEMETEGYQVNTMAAASVHYGYEETGLKAATIRTTKVTDTDGIDESQKHEHGHQVERHSRSFSAPEVTLTEESHIPGSDEGSSSEDDDDVFYTPNTSPRVSVASTVSVSITTAQVPLLERPPSSPEADTKHPHLTRSPSSRSAASTSADSSSTDGHSIFSSYASSSGSTTLTTPEPSIHSPSKGRPKAKGRETSLMREEEWAKDVRWLVPPSTTSSSSSSISSRRKSGTRTHKTSRSSSANKYHPTIMTTLVEEDEGIPQSISRANSRSSQSRGKSASNISSPKRRSSTRSSSHSTPPIRPNLTRRRSRSLEDIAAVGLDRQDDLLSSSSVSSSTYVAHATATPSLPSYGTPGYTSLTLPRAPPPSSGFLDTGKKVGKVDLTRSGVAQTTMASVEVTRGLSSTSSSKRFSWLSKDKDLVKTKGKSGQDSLFSFTSYRKPPTQVPEGHALVQVWAVGVDGVDASLCGLPIEVVSYERRSLSESGRDSDEATSKRNRSARRNSSPSTTSTLKLKQPEVGFVPGRSFVGRIMEVGDEGGARKKGEWVVGLLDARKCGALQEFVVIDRHRIHSVPHPALPPSGLFDPTPLPLLSPAPSVERPEHEPHDSRYPAYTPTRASLLPEATRSQSRTQLTLEELALLPACGVQAYRAVRTFGWGRHTKGRILVIRGHDGVGAVATQMLVNRGWRVCVHAPLRNGSQTQEEDEMRSIKERVTSWGADEVIFDGGDADGGLVGAIQQLIDDNEMFDGILDTVGGKEIWDLGKKLLGRGGSSASDSYGMKQFTTLVGDFPQRPVPSASDHFKASLRSMKGADGDGTCRVAYSWVSIDQDVDFEGGDIAVGLGKLLAECTGSGELRPYVGAGRVVTFERAHEIFRIDGGLESGQTVVVRIVS